MEHFTTQQEIIARTKQLAKLADSLAGIMAHRSWSAFDDGIEDYLYRNQDVDDVSLWCKVFDLLPS